MFWPSLITLLVLLPVNCFFPGYILIRRSRLGAAEKICASVGLSLIIVYLAAWSVFLLNLDWRCCWIFTACAIAAAAISVRDFSRFVCRAHVRRIFAAFGAILLVGLLYQFTLAHYSGDRWAGDWIEHYDRTRFFLEHLPHDTIFIRRYSLPARPPMSNLIDAYFLGQVGRRFDLFQATCTFLNAISFLPCVMLAGHIRAVATRKVWLITAMLLTCPMFIENITFTWNKQLAAFFILTSIAFYLRGWLSNRRGHVPLAALFMAAGLLVHYSAGPYAVLMGMHFACVLVKRKDIRALVAPAAIAIALLFTWFTWSIFVYGPRNTFASNTAVTGREKLTSAQKLAVVQHNLFSTLVPHPLHISRQRFDEAHDQPNTFGYVRDYAFNLYQVNLPMALGTLGWIAAVYIAYRCLRGADRRVVIFWLWLILIAIVVGIAVEPERDDYGSAHICLQPLVLIGRVCIAAGLMLLPRPMRMMLILSFIADVALGIVLQMRIQMLPIHNIVIGGEKGLPMSTGLLNYQAVMNSVYRFEHDMPFLCDHVYAVRTLLLACAIAATGIFILYIAKEGLAIAWRSAAISGWMQALAVLFIAAAVACCCDQLVGFTLAGGL